MTNTATQDRQAQADEITARCTELAEQADDAWMKGCLLAQAAWAQPWPTDPR